ncbi:MULTISPECIES: hypothetical protein [Streptosporangium]|uniref:DUF4149 domain-containing protein n=1 Tax=Streptosporangium brasiliense TaxID=47480 RepID=A0ABT9R3S9_9ACTN|nr:hypothetical protein [Streptosporangium brasiliense]MDP9863105.1 hypothetical protein [Streptosporangium brasiliense]
MATQQHAPQTLNSPPAVPAAVKTASALWLTAVGAGAFEAALAVTGALVSGSASFADLAGGLGFRLAVFAVAIFMAVRLRQGRGWARIALALSLGIFGTISLVIEPIRWLLDGNSLGQAVAEADAMSFVFAGSRIVHLVAVLGAMAMMFAPAANDYFRGTPRLPRA